MESKLYKSIVENTKPKAKDLYIKGVLNGTIRYDDVPERHKEAVKAQVEYDAIINGFVDAVKCGTMDLANVPEEYRVLVDIKVRKSKYR